jgi:beta-galactosidase
MHPSSLLTLFKNRLALPATAFCILTQAVQAADSPYVPPPSPRAIYCFNPGWKFIKQDIPGAEAPAFDDSKWDDVSLPHTYNDVDSYRKLISHGGGDTGEYHGPAWYRKHFKLPAGAKDGKVFVEFEGIRQSAHFFVNGKAVGEFDNGVTACGIDITQLVNFGSDDNVLAVRVDNGKGFDPVTKSGYEWDSNAFNPNYGGLHNNAWLHLTGKVYQTLPLYENLQTTGVYIAPANFSIKDKTCDLTVDSQVRNEADQQVVALSVDVVDADGKLCDSFNGDTSDMVNSQSDDIMATGHLTNVHWWSTTDPYLYDVYTILKVNDKVIDVVKTRTGFRKVEYKGGTGTGGVYINDQFVYLKGYAQRSSDDWAGLGEAYPDWMHDFNAALVRQSNANYIRWMHITPQRIDEEACDRYGIANLCPAGDKEGDVEGPEWDQRVAVMRDSIIYMRNHPGIIGWEAGNNGISGDHMKQMVDLRKQWDPTGGRAMGCRDIKPDADGIAEYYGIMVGQDDSKDKRKLPTDIFRTFSEVRRDKLPYLEAEDFREEAPRGIWDDFSPPSFGFKPGPNDTYSLNSETFCVGRSPSSDGKYASDGAIKRYYDYYSNRISNTDAAHAKWSGYASIYWSDSNADGREDSSEVCRVSGKVDSVRLPKQAFYAYRVMQNDQPDIHIIGHWTYPANTTKTMYVVSNCDSVELFVNNKSVGVISTPTNGYLFPFPSIAWKAGEIRAEGTKGGKVVCEDKIETAGAPSAIKLTPITGPQGLQANGSDVALFDVEVVDDKGERCPTDEARIDFKVDGPCIWRGGVNTAIVGSTNNLYLNTECGINRVSIRSTLTPGTITLTATRDGLKPATVTVESKPVTVTDGLTTEMPQRLPPPVPGAVSSLPGT